MSVIQNESNNLIGEVRGLLQKNRELLEQIYDLTYKTKRYMFWNYVMNIGKIAIILITLIITLVYFLPAFKNVFDLYTGGLYQ